VDSNILDPRDAYEDSRDWHDKARKLATMFIDNFTQFADTERGKMLIAAGPQIP